MGHPANGAWRRFLALGTSLACAACVGGLGGEGPLDKDEVASATLDGKTDWSMDPCKAYGWYGDGYCDWFCPADPVCDSSPFGPEPQGAPLRYPIMLVHGFNASPGSTFAFNENLVTRLRGDGHKVFVARLPPYAGVRGRAQALAREVDDALGQTGAPRIHIIAHSQGGLDARYLVSVLRYGDRVASVTMMGTPHRGTPAADVALALLPSVVADQVARMLAALFGVDSPDDPNFLASLRDLSTSGAAVVSARCPDDSRVYYQSYAGVSRVLGTLDAEIEAEWKAACDDLLLGHPGTVDRMSVWLVSGPPVLHGPSDGLVEVSSAKGTNFRGCLPADHLDLVGYGASGPLEAGFDYVRFYRNLAFELAAVER